MHSLELCKQHLAALSKGDLPALLSMFKPGATIVSPNYGVLDPPAYYARFLAETDLGRAIARLRNVFVGHGNQPRVCLHFHYTWVRKDGRTAELDCINVYELTDDQSLFTKVTTIYDTAALSDRRQAPKKIAHIAG